MNTKLTEIENKRKTLCKELETAVRGMIEPVNRKLLVTDVTIGMMSSTISLTFSSDKTKMICLTYYSNDCGSFKEGQLTTNIGTFGSFDLTSENDVAGFYIEVGNLLSNKEMLGSVRKITKEYSEYMHELIAEYRSLSKKEN